MRDNTDNIGTFLFYRNVSSEHEVETSGEIPDGETMEITWDLIIQKLSNAL